jgi:hypothetical protein
MKGSPSVDRLAPGRAGAAAAGLCVGLLALLLSACQSSPEQPAAGTGSTAKDPASLMQEYLAAGRQKIDEGSVVEGARQLVAVLAERQSLASPSPAAAEAASRAEAELTKLAAALALDSGVEWLDADKNQLTGSTLDVGSPGAMQPSVVLSYNMGRGRTLVSAAPIAFEFARGSGTLTGFVSTNEYGQATCLVARLDSQTGESVVRAALAVTVNGYTWRPQGIERDFVFVPPSRRATILALERFPKGSNQPPIILDAVYNTLKGVAFDFSHYDGVLMGDAFGRVFSGDPKAIQALGMEKEVSYLVMVLNDCTAVNQVVVDGKTYNIFRSQITATARIIRVADGKILYSAAIQSVQGQGGDAGKAAQDGLRKAAAGMADRLARDLPEISAALAAGKK